MLLSLRVEKSDKDCARVQKTELRSHSVIILLQMDKLCGTNPCMP